jgi:hypothetical protein
MPEPDTTPAADVHACNNCEGIDPGSCLMNPGRGEPDNPAATALARHIADHPMSTVQAAFRLLGGRLDIDVQDHVGTPGCDCGHDEMDTQWHANDCAWKTTAGAAGDTGANDPYQVWPLARILREVAVGSDDWPWEEEWVDLDRRHKETGYLAKLEQQIRENGITMPVLIGSDGRLWDGHHRLRIASRLGIEYVPVEIAKPTPEPASNSDLTADEAQDAVAFTREMCDIADRKGTPVTTARVREWLKGPRPGHRVSFPPPPAVHCEGTLGRTETGATTANPQATPGGAGGRGADAAALEGALRRVRDELDRIAALPTVTTDDGHADRFSTGARWTLRLIRAALTQPAPEPGGGAPGAAVPECAHQSWELRRPSGWTDDMPPGNRFCTDCGEPLPRTHTAGDHDREGQ